MDKIRVGVVGLKHGMAHVLEVLNQPEYDLVALCSKTPDTYEFLCGKKISGSLDNVTFTDPRSVLIEKSRELKDFKTVTFYQDYEQFLNNKDIDAVMIAVPIPLNAEFSIRALEKNKHVLASKPFAMTLDQGLKLKQVAFNASTVFMLNFEFRHSPLIKDIKRQLDLEVIGGLQLMWWNMFRMPFRGVYSKKELSGGPFVAEICHWFDLFSLFNSEIYFQKVFAFGGLNVLGDQQEIEDNAVCVIEYANEVRASLNYTYFTDQPYHNQFGLVGSQGKLTATTDDAGSYMLFSGKGQNKTEFTVNETLAHKGHLGFDVSHRLFSEAILENQNVNKAEATRGFENTLLTLAAQMSVDKGKIITRDELININ